MAYILRRSPDVSETGGSDLRGLKWHTQWFRDTHVGNAIPAQDQEQTEYYSIMLICRYTRYNRMLKRKETTNRTHSSPCIHAVTNQVTIIFSPPQIH